MELRNILIRHARLYPKIQIQDMVKLIFQNEFAGGHLIKSEEDSLQRLLAEYDSLIATGNRPRAGSLFTDIGNRLCRLDLSILKETSINPSTVNRFFVNTARTVKGSIQGFEDKLDILKKCRNEVHLHPQDDLEAYLADYRSRGFPPVSHSEVYRAAYSPAYRIVKSDYHRYLEIFLKIDTLLKSERPVRIAIDGNSGGGKSTLAALIANVYDCNLFHTDDFFLRPEQRSEQRLRETGGNVDYERFYQEITRGLNTGKPFRYRIFNCRQMALGETVWVEPKPLNIIEGSYSMHPKLSENYDLKIFVQIDPQEQARRILERNGDEMLKRFLHVWIPMENKYFEEMKVQQQCDLVYGNHPDQ